MWDGISASWAIEHDLERSKTFAADAYVICSRAKNERPEKWMRPQSGTHPMFTLEMRERQETLPIPPARAFRRYLERLFGNPFP
jgi:hypothetical protein